MELKAIFSSSEIFTEDKRTLYDVTEAVCYLAAVHSKFESWGH